jgi:hypothetical protein
LDVLFVLLDYINVLLAKLSSVPYIEHLQYTVLHCYAAAHVAFVDAFLKQGVD